MMVFTDLVSPSGLYAITYIKLIFHPTAVKILFQDLIILPFCTSKPHAETNFFFILLMFI